MILDAFMWFFSWLFRFMHPFTFIYLYLMGMSVAVLLKNRGYTISESFGLSFFWLNFLIHPNGYMWHFCFTLKWDVANTFSYPWAFVEGIALFLLSVFYLKKYKVTKLLTFDRWVLLLYLVDVIFHIWWIDFWARGPIDCCWYEAMLHSPEQAWREFIPNHLATKSIQLLLFLAIWRKHFDFSRFREAPWRWKF